MVEDLLLLARSDSGAIELERVPVDLGDVVADGASALAKPAADRGVRVEVDPEPAVVTGDPARLRQLVMILVDNAIRHSPTGGAGRGDASAPTPTAATLDRRRRGARDPARRTCRTSSSGSIGPRAPRAAGRASGSRSPPGSWSATAAGSRWRNRADRWGQLPGPTARDRARRRGRRRPAPQAADAR